MSLHPASIWLDAHWDELPNNVWVAANSNRVVAYSENLDELLSVLNYDQVDLTTLVFAYVTFDIFQ